MDLRNVLLIVMTALLLSSTTVCAVPTLTVTSPQNSTYATTSIDLDWYPDEPLSMARYSVDSGVYTNMISWYTDTGIVSGLPTEPHEMAPQVFTLDGTTYMISGGSDDYHSYNWTGSAWQVDTGIQSGLNPVSGSVELTIYEKDSTTFLLSSDFLTYNGYNWTGSAWQNDTSIEVGLITGENGVKPHVFYLDGNLYAIIGTVNGERFGYVWGGTQWVSNSTIVSGFPFDFGSKSCFEVVHLGDTYYALVGEGTDEYNGFRWTGSSWTTDSYIYDGLYSNTTTPYILSDLRFTTFILPDDDEIYLVQGELAGYYYGFKLTPTNTTFNATEGTHNISVEYINTTDSSMYEDIVYFTVDTTYPQISFIAPTPDDTETVQSESVIINLSIIESSIDTVTLSWNGTNETMTETYVTKTFGADGNYPFYACVNDTAGNINCTATRTVTSEYLSYQAYLESIATITSTKNIGEVPAGAILGLTENVSISDVIKLVIIAVILGFGIFGYSAWSKRP